MFKSEFKHEEPMDTGEILYEGYAEEGEIQSSDDEVCWTEGEKEGQEATTEPASFGLSLDSAQELKRINRAKRFSMPVEQSETVTFDSDIISRLYVSLGIDKENERHYRFNTVHMRGTQDMSTEDVFEYFTLFTPTNIEWINDVSCNVVWADHISAAKALLNLSKEIKNLDKIRYNSDPFKKDLDQKTEEMVCNIDNDAVDAREIEVAIPPGHWRIGVPSKKSQAILLRFATRSDKKQKYAEKNSQYYKKYGNPHFGNLRGIVSNSLRSEVFNKYKKKVYSNSEYGGDRNLGKNPWGHLAEEWSKQDEVRDVRSKISLKRQKPSFKDDLRLSIINKHSKRLKRQVESESESSQSEDDDDHVRGKFPKMKMYADEEEKIENNSRRNKINSQLKVPFVEDLRLKIDRSRKRKEMLDQGCTSKRRMYWNRYNHTKRDDEYDEEEDEDDGGEDEDDEDEEKGSTWALENYSDLRESLEQNKKYRISNNARKLDRSDEEDKDDVSDDVYNGDFHHRSPLQIEFENDDYFENDSV